MSDTLVPLDDYADFLEDLKGRIRSAQTRAALAVNSELVLLYWSSGRDRLAREEQQGWGAKVIDRLAEDLRHEVPEMRGFSPRNLRGCAKSGYRHAFPALRRLQTGLLPRNACQSPFFAQPLRYMRASAEA